MSTTKVRIVAISDTHNRMPGEGYALPTGDVLIHAGDLSNQGSLKELQKAIDWISKADFAVKIVVAGNHDLSLDPQYALKHESGWNVVPADVEACRALVFSNPDIVYLQHSEAVINIPNKNVALRVFGSPYSPDRGYQNWAFQYRDAAESIWNAIPKETDLLITHTPPAGYLDASQHWKEGGCEALSAALCRVRPMLHVCGHCHEGRGAMLLRWDDKIPNKAPLATRTWTDPGANSKKQSLLNLATNSASKDASLQSGTQTAVVNASITAESYGRGTKTFNKPIVVNLQLPIRSSFDSAANEASGYPASASAP